MIRNRMLQLMALAMCCGAMPALAERINQEGRLLGPAPVVTNSILFNTPEADGVLSAMQVFPVTHPWNEEISRRPLLPNSDAMITQIAADLSASRRTLRVFFEMNFEVVQTTGPNEGPRSRVIRAGIMQLGTNASLAWTGGIPPFVVEQTPELVAVAWSPVLTTAVQRATLPMSERADFFRVRQP